MTRHSDGKDRNVEDLLPTDGTSDFQIDLAGLSDEAQQDIINGLADMTEDQIDSVDLDGMLEAAERVDDKQDLADEYQIQQREAVEGGDYEAARNAAQAAEYELKEAESMKEVEGWFREDSDEAFEVIETEQDAQALDAADWHQNLGEEHMEAAETAADYVGDGVDDDADRANVESHLDAADDQFEAADNYADSTTDGYDDMHDDNDYGD